MSSHGAEAPNTTAIPLVKDIFGVSADFLGQLRTWFEQNPPSIPITQIVGFTQFTAQVATTISTFEGTASAAYTDLATVGPTLTGLPDGKYLIAFGANGQWATAAGDVRLSIQVNSTAAVDADSCFHNIQAANSAASIMRVVPKTLSNAGSNTVTSKYRTTAGTANFENRWLFALRYANL